MDILFKIYYLCVVSAAASDLNHFVFSGLRCKEPAAACFCTYFRFDQSSDRIQEGNVQTQETTSAQREEELQIRFDFLKLVH